MAQAVALQLERALRAAETRARVKRGFLKESAYLAVFEEVFENRRHQFDDYGVKRIKGIPLVGRGAVTIGCTLVP